MASRATSPASSAPEVLGDLVVIELCELGAQSAAGSALAGQAKQVAKPSERPHRDPFATSPGHERVVELKHHLGQTDVDRGSRLRVIPATPMVWLVRSMNSSKRIAGRCQLRTRTTAPERFLNVCSAACGTEADSPGAKVEPDAINHHLEAPLRGPRIPRPGEDEREEEAARIPTARRTPSRRTHRLSQQPAASRCTRCRPATRNGRQHSPSPGESTQPGSPLARRAWAVAYTPGRGLPGGRKPNAAYSTGRRHQRGVIAARQFRRPLTAAFTETTPSAPRAPADNGPADG